MSDATTTTAGAGAVATSGAVTTTAAPTVGGVTMVAAPEVIGDNGGTSAGPDDAADFDRAPDATKALAEANREMARRLAALEERSAADARALAEMRKAARERVLDDVGLLPEYRDVVPPTIDPTTADGRKSLDNWLASRPAMVRPPAVQAVQPADLIPVDEKTSWLRMSAEQLRGWVDKSAHYRANGRRA